MVLVGSLVACRIGSEGDAVCIDVRLLRVFLGRRREGRWDTTHKYRITVRMLSVKPPTGNSCLFGYAELGHFMSSLNPFFGTLSLRC